MFSSSDFEIPEYTEEEILTVRKQKNDRKPIGDHTVDEMFNDIRSAKHQ